MRQLYTLLEEGAAEEMCARMCQHCVCNHGNNDDDDENLTTHLLDLSKPG
jgi:hypothetical protein